MENSKMALSEKLKEAKNQNTTLNQRLTEIDEQKENFGTLQRTNSSTADKIYNLIQNVNELSQEDLENLPKNPLLESLS